MAKKLFNELETVTQHSISDFLLDEEASIPKGRLLAIGSLTVVLAVILGVQDALAGHRSHRSHSSHRSGAWHASHRSHTSARGGTSHGSHSSHSSGGYHSNATPRPTTPATPDPVSPSVLKIPQTLPDTIPVE